jgi:hypothetical protein
MELYRSTETQDGSGGVERVWEYVGALSVQHVKGRMRAVSEDGADGVASTAVFRVRATSVGDSRRLQTGDRLAADQETWRVVGSRIIASGWHEVLCEEVLQ